MRGPFLQSLATHLTHAVSLQASPVHLRQQHDEIFMLVSNQLWVIHERHGLGGLPAGKLHVPAMLAFAWATLAAVCDGSAASQAKARLPPDCLGRSDAGRCGGLPVRRKPFVHQSRRGRRFANIRF
jgi:hypothetical protein